MPDYVIPPPPVAAVPVQGGGLFPVRRIFCVGRNYAEHVREMGGDLREPPFFFTKPADAIVTGGAAMPYPSQTAELHHEMELVAAIGTGGANIPAARALAHVWGYAAGLDMTRRDMQAAAKKAGKPWDMAKGFDHSAPIGELVPAARFPDPTRGRIALRVNGAVRQEFGSVEHDLERGRDGRLSVRPGGAGAGRPDLHRHARGRGGGGAGRRAGRRDRGRGRGARSDHLTPIT